VIVPGDSGDRSMERRAQLAFNWRQRSVHVHGDVAWVNCGGTVRVDRGVNASTLPYRLTAVLLRRDQWRWQTFNGSQPHPS
jgi:ketosteroid isomerase-like protein